MNVRLLAVAEVELAEAVDYYNGQSEGLGFEFAAEVRQTLERIVEHPEAWHPLTPRTRRCRTRRFPYGVLYRVRDEEILVVAVMHLRRAPQSWRKRLGGRA
ncbi:MAG: type II toxin-antitoxin system RelE/ParE family toxin [Armatimonadetes bacterium]|nr:type II toxin-antitoxin system RelE/ParE family toxin [Armatimonadota bacterium]